MGTGGESFHPHPRVMTFTLENAKTETRVSFTPNGAEYVVMTTWKFGPNTQSWYEACTRKHFTGNARNCYRSLLNEGWIAV